MQIRLTVTAPPALPPQARAAHATGCDVLVTAPAGTALAAVTSGLASAVGAGEGPVVLYAGTERLDPQRCTLGEPPLLDGAVLTLGAPAEPGPEVQQCRSEHIEVGLIGGVTDVEIASDARRSMRDHGDAADDDEVHTM